MMNRAKGVTPLGVQAVVQRGEEIFVITVQGTKGTPFRGSYLAATAPGESKSEKIEGTVPEEFTAVETGMYLTLQKLSEGGRSKSKSPRTAARRSSGSAPTHLTE